MKLLDEALAAAGPWGLVIEAVLWLSVVGMIAGGGWMARGHWDGEKIATLQGKVDSANLELGAAASALDDVNKAAAAKIAAAKAAQADAEWAQRLAEAAKVQLTVQVSAYKRRLADAEKDPKCKALLDTDLGATCALQLH